MATSHLPESALDPAPEGWDDYELVNAAQWDAHMRATCEHDQGAEWIDTDADEGEIWACVMCGETWNAGVDA